MEFPALVFKSGGSEHSQFGKYSYIQVCSDEELTLALQDGWSKTLESAFILDGELVEESTDLPPTREELIQKAKELGIQFHHKLGDEKILKLINDKLAE